MYWCSRVSLSSKSWGFCGFCPGFSSSLLDRYSEESSFWAWAGGGSSTRGGAVFFAGVAGLGLDDDPNDTTGALAKPSCLSLGS